MVDLRVDVVGPAGQHDAPTAGGLHLTKQFGPLGAHIILGSLLLGPGQLHSPAYLLLGNIPFLFTQAHQPVRGHPLAGKGDEGPDIADLPIGHGFHIVFQILRVGHHHRAVIVVLGSRRLLMLIEHAGVEDGLDALVNEPLHMAMGQLGRIALRLAGDGLHAQLIQLAGGEGGQLHPEAQGLEETGPEGIVFAHIQHPGDADNAPGRIFQRRIVEHPLLLVFHHAGGTLRAGAAQAPLAAVAGDMPPAAGELVHRQQAVVAAAAAAGGGGGVAELHDLLQGQHAALLTLVPLPGDQRRAEGPHNAGNIRAGDLYPGDLLQGAQHRLVIEGAALHHDVPPQLGRVGQLDDLIQGVFDDGIGKAGGDVRNAGPFLLGLLHVGVHEHGAAGAQIHRVLGKERLLGEALGAVAQGVGEVFDEGAAAGGTGLIQKHGVHRVVFQLDTFHVLPADIQHTVHLGVKEGCRRAVGDGFHLSLVQGKGGFQQGLAVAGGAGAGDMRAFRQPGAKGLHRFHGGLYRVALIVGVERPQQLALLTDQRKLGGGGAGVNAQKAIAAVIFHWLLMYHRLPVTAAELLVLRLGGKQGRQALQFKIHLHTALQPPDQLIDIVAAGVLCLQSRTHGGEQVGVFRVHGGLIGELQGADKGLLQLRQKVQRPAQKGHAAPDGLAAGKARNGLVHHRLEDGGRQVRLGGALVDQRLDIRLGKNAAAGGNWIDLLVVGRLGVETGGVCLQERGHLVDEGAGAPGADAIHPFFQAARKVYDLGVFAAQLNGYVGLRGGMLQSRGNCHDLLHKLDVQRLTQVDGAGAGDAAEQLTVPGDLPGVPQKLCQRLLCVGPVAAVIAEHNAIIFVKNYKFNCS